MLAEFIAWVNNLKLNCEKLDHMGKFLIIVGIVCIVVGLLINYAHKIPFLGKLPGDIFIEKGNVKVYFPIATSILISILLSLLLFLYNKLKH
jgi:hypothetical protein